MQWSQLRNLDWNVQDDITTRWCVFTFNRLVNRSSPAVFTPSKKQLLQSSVHTFMYTIRSTIRHVNSRDQVFRGHFQQCYCPKAWPRRIDGWMFAPNSCLFFPRVILVDTTLAHAWASCHRRLCHNRQNVVDVVKVSSSFRLDISFHSCFSDFKLRLNRYGINFDSAKT